MLSEWECSHCSRLYGFQLFSKRVAKVFIIHKHNQRLANTYKGLCVIMSTRRCLLQSTHEINKIPSLLSLQLCSSHLPSPSDAPNHYQAVCRALYAESRELRTFLEKIRSAKEVWGRGCFYSSNFKPTDFIYRIKPELQPRENVVTRLCKPLE